MPWLESVPPDDAGPLQWYTAIKHAMTRRLSAQQLAVPLKELQQRHQMSTREIANVLLGFRSSRPGADDPLLFRYAELFLKIRLVKASDLLLALLKTSSFTPTQKQDIFDERRTGVPSCEERIFALVLNSEFPSTPDGVLELVFAVFRWLKVISELEMGKQLENGALHTLDTFSCGIYETLGTLAITVLSNKTLREFIELPWWRERRAKMISQMENFDIHVLQWMNSSLSGRLRGLVNAPPFIEIDKNGRPIFTDRQILDSIPEVPVVQSRAGLFVWLNAALIARPVTDDIAILTFLQSRYAGDAQAQIVGLLVASFDVLTNAIIRKEPRLTIKVIRSFICNKVPILLAILGSTIPPPTSTGNVIQMAFGHLISMDPLPPITSGATNLKERLKSTRLDFLQACALHNLTNESIISSILQEAIALPRVTKYNKDSLVAQCINNHGRIESLIDDLDGMQGNAGAVAGCVVQTINNLCMSKDTMSLKTVCQGLINKIYLMDIIMQYAQPTVLLLPLCTLLNDWVNDPDQTECTPAYEEFATILLLTLALIHRYDLDRSELGVLADNFVAELLERGSIARPVMDLSNEQTTQLSSWIEGLFAVDEHGETNGITDEVMKGCSPQSFYLLVPTLFAQSILACKSNALPMKTFKVGLELLLEPFLLPSLVMGLGWLAQHSWEDHNDADILLQVFEKLINHEHSSPDVKSMFNMILWIVATPIHASLQELLRKRPDKKKAAELVERLKPRLHHQRTLRCSEVEVENWTTAGQNLEGRMQQTISQLVTWCANTSIPPNPPPSYTYTDFAAACQLLGGDKLMRTLLKVLLDIPSSDMAIALDVCVAMICAPTASSSSLQQPSQPASSTLKLRDYLRVTAANLQGLLKRPNKEAEVIVNLGRLIEAQIAASQLPPVAMPIPIQEQAADQIIQDLGLDFGGDTSGDVVHTSLDQNASISGLEQQLDLTDLAAASTAAVDMGNSQIFGDISLDLDQVQPDDQQMDMQNQEEDIFADLDLGDDFNFG